MPSVRSRRTLDNFLNRVEWTLMLISGDSAEAKAIQAMAEQAFSTDQTQRKTLRLPDLTILTAAERSLLGNAPERWVVLARNTRDVAADGALADLIKASGEPSIRRLRRAFRRGDLG